MKRKLKKETQLTLTNPRNAGRKAIHDIGIRHIKREVITRERGLHLTIKLKKADIQNKMIPPLQNVETRVSAGRLDSLN